MTIHSAREGGIVSEFTYNILAAVAQEESRKLSERVWALPGGKFEEAPLVQAPYGRVGLPLGGGHARRAKHAPRASRRI